jgi:glycerate kinase
MATSSGIDLLREDHRDPMRTTTFGTGQLLKAAFLHDAPVFLAGGGSATVDGGVGAAMALGWRFLDARDREIGFGGAGLERLARIIPPVERRYPEVTVLADVDHPLCGPRGAARIFGPQKGARAEDLAQLERGLEQLAQVVKADLGIALADLPGGGAAGGLAAGAVAFFGARIRSGGQWVREVVDLRGQLADADWVITGEGCFDATSLCGKVVSGVLDDARETGTRVAVLAGSVRLEEKDWRAAGVQAVFPLVNASISLEQALDQPYELLAERAAAFASALLG